MILFFFPHQDDEFFIYPLIENAILEKEELRVYYLTNGRYKNFSSEIRKKESISALTAIGCAPSSIFMLGHEKEISDGQIIYNLDLIYKLLNSIFSEVGVTKLSKIIVPAWEGGHHDHDALNFIVKFVALKHNCLGLVNEFYLYNSNDIKKPFFRVMAPINRDKLVKYGFSQTTSFRMLISSFNYKSQYITFLGLLPQALYTILFKKEIELSYCKDLWPLKKPHIGKVLYERRGRFEFNVLMNLINEFLKKNQ
jgi:GlcNAc-PI de-N-acetylase